jgi:hypothetical protein
MVGAQGRETKVTTVTRKTVSKVWLPLVSRRLVPLVEISE